jgi:hypothetical protein
MTRARSTRATSSTVGPANGLPAGDAATVFNLQHDPNLADNLSKLIEQNHLAQFSAKSAHNAATWVLGSHSAQSVHDRIWGLLQSGQHPIIGLAAGADHAVVAYDVEPADPQTGIYYIDVYDPNRPYQGDDGTRALDSRIKIDPASGWSFTMEDGSTHSGGYGSFLVFPPSVVSGHLTKPTSLLGLGTFIFNALGEATPAPGSSAQAGAADAYGAALASAA